MTLGLQEVIETDVFEHNEYYQSNKQRSSSGKHYWPTIFRNFHEQSALEHRRHLLYCYMQTTRQSLCKTLMLIVWRARMMNPDSWGKNGLIITDLFWTLVKRLLHPSPPVEDTNLHASTVKYFREYILTACWPGSRMWITYARSLQNTRYFSLSCNLHMVLDLQDS